MKNTDAQKRKIKRVRTYFFLHAVKQLLHICQLYSNSSPRDLHN